MLTVDHNQLPLKVKVANTDNFCFFNIVPGHKLPIETGDEITLTARPKGMYTWFYFTLPGQAGNGAAGFVHISGIEVK